ncbi:hypothetical protein CK203_043227 [Vitis vinifera]|uniref:Uncharacterized protein n=1 Tax=Vitis vinifera TaxID=29760 RepID=A0A438HPC0_VITVI|nr:hypothetical protein CK203_043227 [Vitis vinifera]
MSAISNFPAAHRHRAAPVGVSEAGKFGFRSAVASVPFQVIFLKTMRFGLAFPDDICWRSQAALSHSRKAAKYPSVQMALVDERVARGRNLAKPSRILAYDLVQGPLEPVSVVSNIEISSIAFCVREEESSALKLNFDHCSLGNLGQLGIGGSVRKHDGRLLTALSKPIGFVYLQKDKANKVLGAPARRIRRLLLLLVASKEAPRQLQNQVRWSSIADKSIPDPPTAVLVHGILGSRKNWGRYLCLEIGPGISNMAGLSSVFTSFYHWYSDSSQPLLINPVN